MQPTLIVTRPAAQARDFLDAVTARWRSPLDIVVSPLLQIVPTDATVGQADGVIFTSVHGVAAAVRLGVTPGITAWCVGTKTAAAAHDVGFSTITGPGDAAGLAAQIIASGFDGHLVHIRGKHTRGDITLRLTQAGLSCRDVIGYDQQVLALSDRAQGALQADTPVIAPLFSPRTAKVFARAGPFAAPLYIIAISNAVRQAAAQYLPATYRVAIRQDADAMIDATLNVLAALYER